MSYLKIVTICLGAAGGATGLIAAKLWLESSKVPIVPTSDFEPLETEDKALYWTHATSIAMTEAARLNMKAARWTAISVFLNTIACVLGVI